MIQGSGSVLMNFFFLMINQFVSKLLAASNRDSSGAEIGARWAPVLPPLKTAGVLPLTSKELGSSP